METNGNKLNFALVKFVNQISWKFTNKQLNCENCVAPAKAKERDKPTTSVPNNEICEKLTFLYFSILYERFRGIFFGEISPRKISILFKK